MEGTEYARRALGRGNREGKVEGFGQKVTCGREREQGSDGRPIRSHITLPSHQLQSALRRRKFKFIYFRTYC